MRAISVVAELLVDQCSDVLMSCVYCRSTNTAAHHSTQPRWLSIQIPKWPDCL